MAPILTRVGQAFGFGAGPSGPFVPPAGITASGGNVDGLSPGNGYKYHTFTSSGSFNVSAVTGSGEVEYLIIGGGGSGGGSGPGTNRYGGAGGGAGGLLNDTLTATAQNYPISIGNGGGSNDKQGVQGNNTTALGLTALGGGSGGFDPGPAGSSGGNGGSGGGGGANSAPGDNKGNATNYPGPTAQGYPGGRGGVGGGNSDGGGGGGGAGGAGNQGIAEGPGVGGIGVQLPAFTGPLVGLTPFAPLNGYWAGGGGGGVYINGSGGAGGAGGGGAGGDSPDGGGNAVVNSGGGGGGASSSPTSGAVYGGVGGKGIVIVRYKI